MVICWAHGIGGCGGGRSKEHLLSRGLLRSAPVTVSGLAWCETSRTVPESALTSRILCRNHNSELSAVDAAGIDAMTSLEKLLQVRGVRRRQRRRQRVPQRYEADGLLLERWMLKTMINLAFEHSTPAGGKWTPSIEWVELAFGKRPFSRGCGLYIPEPRGSILALDRCRLEVKFLTQDGAHIHGAEFDLNGWTMVLSFIPLERWTAHYRPDFVRDHDGLTTWQVMALTWQ